MNAVTSVQASSTTNAGSSGDQGYIVKSGDTLSAIAAQHGVSLSALEKANPQIVHPDLIYAGQHVNIPSGSSVSGSSGGAAHSYTVRSGDTLSGIAAQNGTTWQQLAAANHLSNPNLIFPGQVIQIGGSASSGSGGTSGASGPGATSGPAPSGQGDHQQLINQAMSYFESQGWSKAQAAGIVANLDAESGMRAGIQQYGGGPGYGLAQWEGPRQAAFAQWAGHDIHGSSFAEQLRFVQHELTTSESGAGNALKQATDPRTAGAIVTQDYERPADTAGQSVSRGERAVQIYDSQ